MSGREIRPYVSSGDLWGILNPYGQLWTDETFPTPEGAWDHVAEFWPDKDDRSGYRVVVVRRTIDVQRLPDGRVVDAANPPKWALAARRALRSLTEAKS